jgi:elongation factor G
VAATGGAARAFLVGAVAKLSSAHIGDTLCQRDRPLTLPGLQFPSPVFQMAAYPKSKADVDKMTSALARIVEEDPCLKVTREPNTKEILLNVALAAVAKRMNGLPKAMYR